MKAFIIWLLITLGVYGASGVGYHLYLSRSPRKILVAVDSSYEMKSNWPRISRILDRIGTGHYRVYCLVTEKTLVHDWSKHLELGSQMPYAPRDFSRLSGPDPYPEIKAADKRYLITNAVQLKGFSGWEIVRPE